MNKKVIIGIGICIIIVLIGLFVWINLHSFDKSNPIIFEKSETEEYSYIIYQGRTYVPYCAFSSRGREKYLGYVGNDKQDEIYTVKGYSEKEWLISYLDSGMMNDCMLYKEQNTTNIPEGLTSEYEWNSIETKDNSNLEISNNEIDTENIDLEEFKQIAKKYYDKTVFEVISIELKSKKNNQVVFEVICKKDGELQEPNRTITLEKENEEWKVINEGY